MVAWGKDVVWEEWEKGITKGHTDTFGVMDMFVTLIVVMVIWCVHRLELFKLYALNMCHLLCAN